MTDIKIQHDQDYRSNNYNYSDMNTDDLENQNKIILDVLIGIFGGLIIINMLILIYYFRETIKSICNRPLRKTGGMIKLGEMSHEIESFDEETESEI
tara:strand:- start:50 stop:340 length:291 start_codon:yes stop_codon:yes gene_type:complete